MRFVFLVGLSLLLAVPVWAAEEAPSSSFTNDGRTFELCNAETSTGVCDNASSVDLYAKAFSYSRFTVTFSETGGSGNTCHVMTGDQELANSIPESLASVGQQITTMTLSASRPVFEFDYPVFLIWADCTAVAGNFSLNVQAQK